MEVVVETVRIDVPVPPADRVTLLVLRLVVGPDGFMAETRLTVPVKPLRLVIVMVDVADDPAWIVRLVGFAVTVKSCGGGGGTTAVIVATCESDPLVPVTVTEYVPNGVDVVVAIVRTEVSV